jgi:sulfite reductase (NADPH) flavoprotein alpha-component
MRSFWNLSFPANDYRERLYSIGKVDISTLSVKLSNGLGSSFLYNLNNGDKIQTVVNKTSIFIFS